MKSYRFFMAAMLCGLLSSRTQGAIPLSLPGISLLQTMHSSIERLFCPKSNPQIGLFLAAARGDLETVKQYTTILTDGTGWYHDPLINPNYAQGALRLTPLMVASANGHTDVVKTLLAAGADIYAKNHHEDTALVCAAACGHCEPTKALMLADDTAQSRKHFGKALLMATANNRNSIAKGLINYGADLNTSDHQGLTALAYAIAKNNATLVQLLIKAGSDIDFCTHTGYNAIILASLTRSSPIIMEMLLKAGTNPNHSDHRGIQALDLALRHEELILVDLLLRYGAQPTDDQNKQLTNKQKTFVIQRCETLREWLLSLEDNYDLPRDLSRLVGTFSGLSKSQNIKSPYR